MLRAPVAVIALACLVAPARAETADDKKKAIAAVFETALGENEVFLNCTATDPEVHKLARANWEETVAASVSLMSSHRVDPAFVAQFRERAAYEKVMRLDAAFRQMVAICQGDWQKRFHEFRFVVLHSRVSDILNR